MQIQKVAEADFPTRFGHFRIYGFQGTLPVNGAPSASQALQPEEEEIVALVMGDMTDANAPPPLVRIHSRCLTGDVFHSLRCDCRAQLEIALEMVAAEGRGVIVYENQEGRGIGLLNKLRAYELQDHGADTVEANEQLGFAADLRDYALPGAVLRYFGLRAVRLLSNNPEKIEALERAGVNVTERVPCIAPDPTQARQYLATKKYKMGHLLD